MKKQAVEKKEIRALARMMAQELTWQEIQEIHGRCHTATTLTGATGGTCQTAVDVGP